MAENTDVSGAGTLAASARLPRSPFAMLSFWCGVASWVAAILTPILLSMAFMIAFPLAFLAAGIGVVALLHIRRTPRAWGGRRWAIAGIILGGFWLALWLAVVVVNSPQFSGPS
jgi:hypothetical protein